MPIASTRWRQWRGRRRDQRPDRPARRRRGLVRRWRRALPPARQERRLRQPVGGADVGGVGDLPDPRLGRAALPPERIGDRSDAGAFAMTAFVVIGALIAIL